MFDMLTDGNRHASSILTSSASILHVRQIRTIPEASRVEMWRYCQRTTWCVDIPWIIHRVFQIVWFGRGSVINEVLIAHLASNSFTLWCLRSSFWKIPGWYQGLSENGPRKHPDAGIGRSDPARSIFPVLRPGPNPHEL